MFSLLLIIYNKKLLRFYLVHFFKMLAELGIRVERNVALLANVNSLGTLCFLFVLFFFLLLVFRH